MGKLLIIIQPNRSRRSPTVDIVEKSPDVILVSVIIWFEWRVGTIRFPPVWEMLHFYIF
jgi:hypothetical protein